MMNRRQILFAAAAGAAMMTRIPNAQAVTYDLLIKGGRVIDPSVGLDAVRDVAIAAGRIVSVEADIVGAGAARRRDWPCRCRIGWTRQHRRNRCSATRRAANRPGSGERRDADGLY